MPGFLAILIGVCATVGFILIFAASNYRSVRLIRGIGSFLLGFPLGLITYMGLGIYLARIHGLSRFYSWPFGGEHIGHDGPLIASGLFWVAVWFVILFGGSNLVLKTSNAARRG